MAEGEVRYTSSSGVGIAYRVTGSGPIDLLWYPGAPLLPMDSVDDEPAFSRFHARLRSIARVIQFDARGIGLSDRVPPGSPPTLDEWVSDAVAVLDAAAAAEVAMIAPRDEALLGILLAATQPERVSRLVVINGTARFRRAADYPEGIPNEQLDGFLTHNTAADLPRDAGVDFLQRFAPTVADDPAFRLWWERAGQRGGGPTAALSILRVVYDADVRDRLGAIRAPTLVLHNRGSQGVGPRHGRYIADHIAGSRYIELPAPDALYWVGDVRQMLDEIEEFLTGRLSRRADRVLRTVLFTDIVASTQKLAELGDRRGRELWERHDAVVRRQLGRFSGHLVKSTGDGVMATFDSPALAAAAALAIRDEVQSLGLHIRAGVHTGEIEIRGEDIAGMAVHIAARIAALAGADEVLVSRTVVDLTLGSDLVATPRGDFELKGVPVPVTLYALGPNP
ncbi:MAG: adenylate/guanylate cyclase domain-containing protein [Acidimicrobiales bacterium]